MDWSVTGASRSARATIRSTYPRPVAWLVRVCADNMIAATCLPAVRTCGRTAPRPRPDRADALAAPRPGAGQHQAAHEFRAGRGSPLATSPPIECADEVHRGQPSASVNLIASRAMASMVSGTVPLQFTSCRRRRVDDLAVDGEASLESGSRSSRCPWRPGEKTPAGGRPGAREPGWYATVFRGALANCVGAGGHA